MKNIRKTHPIIKMMNSSLIDLPVPSNISHFWNFGSMLGTCLSIQIITGIFLAMHFSADISIAFNCVDHIMRDVSGGWFTRLLHANGASLFFFAMYLHVGRGLYFNSFVLSLTWLSGIMLFLMTMMTAFLGYVLPWGQMSYWGATVITNLLSAIPYLGQTMVEWIWGGFSVNNATLTRFFSLHYLLPFVILLLVIVHFIFLHSQKSSNPLGVQKDVDKLPFHPYFSFKDISNIFLFLFILLLVNKLAPFSLMDPDNFSPANPLVTPAHIQPEWYFLFAYAILRAIPNKLGGVMGLLASILILAPLAAKSKMTQFKSMYLQNGLMWSFLLIFLALTILGTKAVESPFIEMGMLFTFLYFSWFIMLLTL
uniref:Cytochrome b n=1 Tax=Pseudobiotus spinifer TaxID=1477120 RepID=A0A0K0KA03_9BILA|nr:cyrochrome b [Pseudobiotus spinifer]